MQHHTFQTQKPALNGTTGVKDIRTFSPAGRFFILLRCVERGGLNDAYPFLNSHHFYFHTFKNLCGLPACRPTHGAPWGAALSSTQTHHLTRLVWGGHLQLTGRVSKSYQSCQTYNEAVKKITIKQSNEIPLIWQKMFSSPRRQRAKREQMGVRVQDVNCVFYDQDLIILVRVYPLVTD